MFSGFPQLLLFSQNQIFFVSGFQLNRVFSAQTTKLVFMQILNISHFSMPQLTNLRKFLQLSAEYGTAIAGVQSRPTHSKFSQANFWQNKKNIFIALDSSNTP